MNIITVCWEDKSVNQGYFGPYELMIKCIADQFEKEENRIFEYYTLKKRINSIAIKGNGNFERHFTKSNSGEKLKICVIDSDKIHKYVKNLTNDSCNQQRIDAFHSQFDIASYCKLNFLVNNMESVISKLADATNRSILKKLSPTERDDFFRVATSQSQRIKFLGNMKSFERLVTKVKNELNSDLTGYGLN